MTVFRFQSTGKGVRTHKNRTFCIYILSALLAIGCDQSSDSTSSNPHQTGLKANAGVTQLQTPADAQGETQEEIHYPDISENEAAVPAPIILVGAGVQRKVDPATLNALATSFSRRGNPMRAKKLEQSYDFTTGEYKGSEASYLSVKPLAKKAWWNTTYIQHRAAVQGYWLPFAGNDEFTGASSGNSAPRIYGYNPQTQIEYGVTPSLLFRVAYAGINTWTTYKKWNDAHSNGNPNQWINTFSAKSTYPDYSVCYWGNHVYPGGHAQMEANCNDGQIGGIDPTASAWFIGLKLRIYKTF